MIKTDITIDDKGLFSRMSSYGTGDGGDGSVQIVKNTVDLILAFVWRTVRAITPRGATKQLVTSIQQSPITGTKISNITGKVSTVLLYGEPVEEGTRPHWVPIEPLKLWAKRVLGDEKIAYAVRWKIFRFGTKGAKMFAKTLIKSRSFINLQSLRMSGELAKWIDGDLR